MTCFRLEMLNSWFSLHSLLAGEKYSMLRREQKYNQSLFAILHISGQYLNLTENNVFSYNILCKIILFWFISFLFLISKNNIIIATNATTV